LSSRSRGGRPKGLSGVANGARYPWRRPCGRRGHLQEMEQTVRECSDLSQLIVDDDIQSDEHGQLKLKLKLKLKLNGDCEVNKDGGL